MTARLRRRWLRRHGAGILAAGLVAIAGCERAGGRAQKPPPVPVEPAPALPPWTGPLCSTDVAPRPERDPSPMCWVPAATFMMGTPAEHAGPYDFLPRKVRISRGFYMDQYEVTVEQFVRFANEVGNQCAGPGPDRRDEGDLCFHPSSVYVTPRSGGGHSPVRGRERTPAEPYRRGALAYCAWADKVLPTEAQWALAAFHDPTTGKDRLYPWGDDVRPRITNCFDGEGGCQDGFQHETPVGTFADDRSATGLIEMGGNLDEWVQDCFVRAPPCGEPCVDPIVTTGCEERDCARDQTCFLSRGGRTAYVAIDAARRHATFLDSGAGFRCAVISDVARRAHPHRPR